MPCIDVGGDPLAHCLSRCGARAPWRRERGVRRPADHGLSLHIAGRASFGRSGFREPARGGAQRRGSRDRDLDEGAPAATTTAGWRTCRAWPMMTLAGRVRGRVVGGLGGLRPVCLAHFLRHDARTSGRGAQRPGPLPRVGGRHHAPGYPRSLACWGTHLTAGRRVKPVRAGGALRAPCAGPRAGST